MSSYRECNHLRIRWTTIRLYDFQIFDEATSSLVLEASEAPPSAGTRFSRWMPWRRWTRFDLAVCTPGGDLMFRLVNGHLRPSFGVHVFDPKGSLIGWIVEEPPISMRRLGSYRVLDRGRDLFLRIRPDWFTYWGAAFVEPTNDDREAGRLFLDAYRRKCTLTFHRIPGAELDSHCRTLVIASALAWIIGQKALIR